MKLISKALGMACVKGITQFYLPPTRLSMTGMSHPAFTPQPQSITALWPVLIFRPAEGRRLSWPGWLVTHRRGVCMASDSIGYVCVTAYNDAIW